MLTSVLIAIAAMLNAAMDTLAHHKGISVFQKFPEPIRTYVLRDWRARYVLNDPRSGEFKTYMILGIPIKANWLDPIHDGWHLFKTLMIISICAAPVVYHPIVSPFVDFFIFGAIWNVVFVLFYDKILR